MSNEKNEAPRINGQLPDADACLDFAFDGMDGKPQKEVVVTMFVAWLKFKRGVEMPLPPAKMQQCIDEYSLFEDYGDDPSLFEDQG